MEKRRRGIKINVKALSLLRQAWLSILEQSDMPRVGLASYCV